MVPTPTSNIEKARTSVWCSSLQERFVEKFGKDMSKAVLAMTAIRLRGVKINKAVNASFFELRDRIFLRNFRYLRVLTKL